MYVKEEGIVEYTAHKSENMHVEEWFLPLNTDLTCDLLYDSKTAIGTFTIHETSANQFMLTLKNKNELSQIPITCITSKCSYFVGTAEDVHFGNLAEIIANILCSRIKIIIKEDEQLIFKNYLRCPLPAKSWFLPGYSNEEAENFLKNYESIQCFAVWMVNAKEYKLGIKYNGDMKTLVISSTKRGYTLDAITYFNNLEKLINYYTINAVPKIENNNYSKKLPPPIMCTTFYASTISQKVKEISKTILKGKVTYDQFQMEFADIEKLSKEFPLTFSFAKEDFALKKNRYKNILACDQTRVELEGTESTYINANFVKSPFLKDQSLYILSQAPIESTFHDHWRMVIKQKVGIILMLTQYYEKEIEKSYKYWPDKDEKIIVDNYEITVEHVTTSRDIIHRQISIMNKNDKSIQTIYIIQYLAWNDFGVPANSWGVIEILSVCYQLRENSYNKTLLVHGSAGIGRTGTIVAIDIILNQIKHEGINALIDVKKTVLEIRKQRALSVNTAGQYRFIYLVIKSYIEWKIGRGKFQLKFNDLN